jgi:putative oxidoreductase
MLNRPLPAPARDIAILIARVILGVVLFAHGWQKLMINGISGTYGQFEKLGIPLAIVSASFASFVEFVGGVLIVLGALTTTVVALDLVVMVGAAGFVHVTHGIFAQNGGWELVGVIVAAELALAAFGPGRLSVDHLIARRHDRERADMERRKRIPVRRAVAVSEAFTPAVDPRQGGFGTNSASAGVPTGTFDAVAQVPAGVPTGAFEAVAPPSASLPTGAFPAAPPSFSTGAFARPEADPAPAIPTGTVRAVPQASQAVDQPVTEAFAAVSAGSAPGRPVEAGEPTPSAAQVAVDASPRMASAGVRRAMSERAAGSDRPAPAPFGVTVQSPLDFTPTTALPVVPADVLNTDTITIATSGPGGLPRRVRVVDLPPASAVRPYA